MFLGYTCPVPIAQCSGTELQAGHQFMRYRVKWHRTPRDVHRCEGRYLLSIGYERLSPTTFRGPLGSKQRERGILVLNRKPGSPVHTGKGGAQSGEHKTSPGGRSMAHMKRNRVPFGEIW